MHRGHVRGLKLRKFFLACFHSFYMKICTNENFPLYGTCLHVPLLVQGHCDSGVQPYWSPWQWSPNLTGRHGSGVQTLPVTMAVVSRPYWSPWQWSPNLTGRHDSGVQTLPVTMTVVSKPYRSP